MPTLTPDSDANDKMGVSVSGTIDDFMTGDVSRPDWTVTLTYDADTSTDGAQIGDELPAAIMGEGAVAKWETGGAVDGEGAWDATFSGSEKDTTHPLAVVGTFNAEIADGAVGRIQGAFGATK